MYKILMSVVIAISVITTPAFADNKPKRYYGGSNIHSSVKTYHSGYNRKYKNRYYRRYKYNYYNNFYKNPYFWGGVAGGIVGGAIINGIQQDPYCREVVTKVYVEGVGYRKRVTVVCD